MEQQISRKAESIRKDTAIQCLKQFPAPLGKMVGELFKFDDYQINLERTRSFHHWVRLYSNAIVYSICCQFFNFREFISNTNSDEYFPLLDAALETMLKKLPQNIGYKILSPFYSVNREVLHVWTKKFDQLFLRGPNGEEEECVWTQKDLYEYLKVLGNELGFLRNFRIFHYEKKNYKLVSQSGRFPAFDLPKSEKGKKNQESKFLGMPVKSIDDLLLIAYNIIENVFIPLAPFIIVKRVSYKPELLYFFSHIEGLNIYYQGGNIALEYQERALIAESKILPKNIRFFQIVESLYKKDCEFNFSKPKWHDEFLLSLVTGEKALSQGIPELLLQKNDEIIFTDINEPQVEKKLVVQQVGGKQDARRGVFTEVWTVKETLSDGKKMDYAIKILRPLFANTLIGDEFNQEIKNMQTLAAEFDNNKAQDYKKYFFIEVKKHGIVRFNKWWSSPCFLMEPADCSLKDRLLNFCDEKKEHEDNEAFAFNSEGTVSTETKRTLYFKCIWAFYCMRHLVATCEKLHSFGGSLFHFNIKPENILYFHSQSRTPLLADFGLAEYGRIGNNSNIAVTKRKLKVFQHSFYAAPELKVGDTYPLHLRTDQYSLGIIFFELIFGEVPILEQDDFNEANIEEIIDSFKRLDAILGINGFENFIKKILASEPAERYDVIVQDDEKFSDLRESFLDLEKVVMDNLVDYFKNTLIPSAVGLIKLGKNEEALNTLDLLFHESVRYSCLFKEEQRREEIAKEDSDYAEKNCRFFIKGSRTSKNPIAVIGQKLPAPDTTNIGGYGSISTEDIVQILEQLNEVLGQCYGFLSHCYPHDSYRQRLKRLLKEGGARTESLPPFRDNLKPIEKLMLMIFEEVFRRS